MEKLKKKKTGFTLVELLVVIAILAVLASVSVIGYLSFVKKAKVSNDSSLITQMNTTLQANEAVDGKNATAHDAIEELYESGLDVNKLSPTTEGYHYAIDMSQNRAFLLDGNYNKVAPENLTIGASEKVFIMVGNEAEIESTANAGYSAYLKNGFSWSEESTTKTITTTKGIDVGDNEGVTAISYGSDETTQTSIIRTNSLYTTVNVSDVKDTVHHYGEAMKINVTAVAGDSYHEHGTVSNIEIKEGRVAIEKGADVNTVVVTGDGVKVDSEVEDVEVKVASSVTTQPEVKVNGETTVTSSKFKFVTCNNDFYSDVPDGVTDFVLSADITSQIKITGKNGITIDMNGHSLSVSNYCLQIYGSSKVEIKGSGFIKCTNNYASAIKVKGNSTLTIHDVTVEANEWCFLIGDTSECENNSGTLIIESGTFTSYNNAVLATDGNKNYGGNTITINGGTFNGYINTSGYIACGIYAANNDTWNVKGGTFNITNGCGILARSGTVNVEKDVIINLDNNEQKTVEGKVGSANVMVISDPLVLDKAATGYAENPIINNNSSYGITTITAYKN